MYSSTVALKQNMELKVDQVTDNETDEGVYSLHTGHFKRQTFFEYAHGMLRVTELTNEDK